MQVYNGWFLCTVALCCTWTLKLGRCLLPLVTLLTTLGLSQIFRMFTIKNLRHQYTLQCVPFFTLFMCS